MEFWERQDFLAAGIRENLGSALEMFANIEEKLEE